MKIFSQYEYKVIEWLVNNRTGTTQSLVAFLEQFFFTKSSKRCLIIQPTEKYAMYFLDVESYNKDELKGEEISQFIELMSLLNYLNNQGYLTIFRGQHYNNQKMIFFGEVFDNPHLEKNKIVLNESGMHSTKPESIKNGDDEIIYKGVELKNGNYDLLYESAVGDFCVSKSLVQLMQVNKPDNSKPTFFNVSTNELELFSASLVCKNQHKEENQVYVYHASFYIKNMSEKDITVVSNVRKHSMSLDNEDSYDIFFSISKNVTVDDVAIIPSEIDLRLVTLRPGEAAAVCSKFKSKCLIKNASLHYSITDNYNNRFAFWNGYLKIDNVELKSLE